MDKLIIQFEGVLSDVINFYEITDQTAGFLQTVFIIFFMIFAPICGFLGDRSDYKDEFKPIFVQIQPKTHNNVR
jgi:MFS family permease